MKELNRLEAEMKEIQEMNRKIQSFSDEETQNYREFLSRMCVGFPLSKMAFDEAMKIKDKIGHFPTMQEFERHSSKASIN